MNDPSTISAAGPTRPERIGGVRLFELLGSGATGKVYRGRHETLDIEVAIKIMKDGAASPDRFVNEARLAARINDRNVVRIHHAGEEAGLVYLVLELVQGGTLKRLLAERGALPWQRAADLGLQAARGLAAIHLLGIVHRDVKPSNMIVTPDGTLKLTDLGLSKETYSDSDLTGTGSVLGTPAFIAPEQARDARQADARSDVYSLGVSLYQMLAGEPPFKRATPTGLLLAHLNEPAPDLAVRVPGLPPALTALVARMLAKDPAERPASGQEVAEELERIIAAGAGAKPAAAPRVVARTERRSPRRVLVALAAAALAVAVGAMAIAAAGRERWQTPERAAFVIDDGVPLPAVAGLAKALAASGLRVVERARIDAVLRELDLVEHGRIDPATAVSVGRLVGGQLALFVRPLGDSIELRAVVIETSELVGSELVAPGETADAAARVLSTAEDAMTAQGYLTRPGGVAEVSLGSRHGLRLGDRLQVLAGSGRSPGAPLATATVTALRADAATVAVDGVLPARDPLPVRRVTP